MDVKIENRTNRPVIIGLNSGRTLRLSPRQASAKIGEAEVRRNDKVKKLKERRVISVTVATKGTVRKRQSSMVKETPVGAGRKAPRSKATKSSARKRGRRSKTRTK